MKKAIIASLLLLFVVGCTGPTNTKRAHPLDKAGAACFAGIKEVRVSNSEEQIILICKD